jgi:hypothetical protein
MKVYLPRNEWHALQTYERIFTRLGAYQSLGSEQGLALVREWGLQVSRTEVLAWVPLLGNRPLQETPLCHEDLFASK